MAYHFRSLLSVLFSNETVKEGHPGHPGAGVVAENISIKDSILKEIPT